MYTILMLYSGTSLFWTPLGQEVSLIERCPHSRGQNVHNTNVIQWNLSILDALETGSVAPTNIV